MTLDSFVAWRSGERDLAAKTLNDYLDAMRVLLKWMCRSGRLAANPLEHVAKVETRGRERRKRRAFTDDEMGRLLAVAGKRAVLYLAAVETGLRRDELAQLQWGDLHLESPRPFVTVRAATTKNKRSATIYIRPQLAGELRAIRPENVYPTFRVFRGRTAAMARLKLDLQSAGIEYLDAEGRQADFHAFRKTFHTNLRRVGVGVEDRKRLMRVTAAKLVEDVYP